MAPSKSCMISKASLANTSAPTASPTNPKRVRERGERGWWERVMREGWKRGGWKRGMRGGERGGDERGGWDGVRERGMRGGERGGWECERGLCQRGDAGKGEGEGVGQSAPTASPTNPERGMKEGWERVMREGEWGGWERGVKERCERWGARVLEKVRERCEGVWQCVRGYEGVCERV